MTRLARPSPEQAAAAPGKPVLAPVSASPHGAAGATLSEAQLHTACAKYLDAVLSPEVIWTTIGHGGGGKIRGAQLKRMGVKRGIPDIMLSWHDGLVNVAWIELKGAKGKLTDEQVVFRHRCEGLGHLFALVRSLRDLEATLDDWCVPVRLSRK